MRSAAREARRAIPAEERARLSATVGRMALVLPGVAEVRAVLAYAPSAEEVDPRPLIAALRAAGARVAYPRVTGPMRLTLHWVDDEAELLPGAFGIREPSEEAPPADPSDIELALVPGVAFDATCNRVGYGGCFYDTLLPLLPERAATVGLAFDAQLVDSVPCEPHDVRLDYVVTPGGVYPIVPGRLDR